MNKIVLFFLGLFLLTIIIRAVGILPFLILPLIILILVVIIEYRTSVYKNEVKEQVEDIVEKHIKVLAQKKERLTSYDEYGYENVTKWNKEICYFVENVLMNELKVKKRFLSKNFSIDIDFTELIEGKIHDYNKYYSPQK